MDQSALQALENWKPDTDAFHVSPCPNKPPNLEHNTSGPGSFVARASYQLPDGGRFSLLLSGTLNEDTLMALVENDLGLPDGFLIDINTFLLQDVMAEGPFPPDQLVGMTLKRANKLYQKQAFTGPQDSIVKKHQSPDSGRSDQSLKRKRSALDRYTPPAFGPNRLATTTLMKQITLLKDMDTRTDGFTAEPLGNDLYTWNVHLYFDDTDSPIAEDLKKLNTYDSVNMEFRFPSEYPAVPPVVRVVSPYVVGGHVAPRGGICMELLTTSGWAPVNSIDVVCIQIRAMLIQGRARVEPHSQSLMANYTFNGALKDLTQIVNRHQWNLPQRKPRRLPS